MTQLSNIYQRPDWLSTTDCGVDDLSQFVVPPRLKIVQPISKLCDEYTQGDLLLMPTKTKLLSLEIDAANRLQKHSPSVLFTPLFFFAQYCKWNPIEDTTGAIIDSTFEKDHEIAIRARDFKRRKEPHPTIAGKFITYREHLNFVVLIHQPGFNFMPVIMSFSGAEHKAGTNFAAMVKMRMAPMYGCQFAFKVVARDNQKGRWYGIEVENPAENLGGFVSQEMFDVTKKFYAELKAAHETRSIRVDHDYEDTDADTLEGTVVNPEL